MPGTRGLTEWPRRESRYAEVKDGRHRQCDQSTGYASQGFGVDSTATIAANGETVLRHQSPDQQVVIDLLTSWVKIGHAP